MATLQKVMKLQFPTSAVRGSLTPIPEYWTVRVAADTEPDTHREKIKTSFDIPPKCLWKDLPSTDEFSSNEG
jgi:hypothetical protein